MRVTVYREVQDNGDELVSEYGDGWQRAYVIPKEKLDFWKKEAAEALEASDDHANHEPKSELA